MENKVAVWTTFPNTGRPNTLVGEFTEEEANKMWKEDTSLNWGEVYVDNDGFTQWTSNDIPNTNYGVDGM